MSQNQAPQAHITTVAEFPPGYFLENLVVRADGSVLITEVNHRELWYVPPSDKHVPVEPVKLHSFDQPAVGIVEVEPDVVLVCSTNLYTTHESFLHRLDFKDWSPGAPLEPKLAFEFPKEARGPNGICLLAPGVILVADCFASLIWRIDLQGEPLARIWLKHSSMGYYPGKLQPEQPGVNGVRYAARSQYLYYTATANKLFMRVPVNPATLEPAGEPEFVVAGRMGDDFCIDEDAQVIYLTTHRQNTIDVVSMDPGLNSGFTQAVAGEPFTYDLIGPSAGAWCCRFP